MKSNQFKKASLSFPVHERLREESDLIAPWIVHQLMAAGVKRLSGVYRVQHHFVSDYHLQGNLHTTA